MTLVEKAPNRHEFIPSTTVLLSSISSKLMVTMKSIRHASTVKALLNPFLETLTGRNEGSSWTPNTTPQLAGRC
jgi:hypothetical protein